MKRPTFLLFRVSLLSGHIGMKHDGQCWLNIENFDWPSGMRGVLVRVGGNVSNDTVGRQAELLKKIEASKSRIRRTQARIVTRKAAGQDARDDERWLAIELDFLRTLEGLLKELKG